MQPKINQVFAIILLASTTAFISISCRNEDQAFHPDIDSEIVRLAALSPSEIPGFMQNLDRSDIISEYYRDPATKQSVIQFFGELTHSDRIAAIDPTNWLAALGVLLIVVVRFAPDGLIGLVDRLTARLRRRTTVTPDASHASGIQGASATSKEGEVTP